MNKSEEAGTAALKATSTSVGQLYPVLLDSNGIIIDGKHRSAANTNWKKITVDSIKTKKERIIARLIANVCRRKISSGEKFALLRDLAKEYLKEGVELGKISHRIKEDTGMSYTWVMKYLPAEFKDPDQRKRRLDTHHVTAHTPLFMLGQKDPGKVTKEVFKRMQTVQNRAVKIKEYKNTGFVAILLEKSFYDRWETICTALDVDPSLLAYTILESRLKELERELCIYRKADSVNSLARNSLSIPIPL